MKSLLEVFLGILVLLSKTNSKPLPEINSVCSGASSVDLLGSALQLPGAMFRSIEIQQKADKRGYRFISDASISIEANEVFENCVFFPSEFSILFSLNQDNFHSENEYLFSLMSSDRRYVLMSLRLRRSRIYFERISQQARNSVSFSFQDKRLSDGNWHSFSLSIAGNYAALIIDCGCTSKIELKSEISNKINVTNSKFYVGSRKRKGNRFTGLIRQLVIIRGSATAIACQTNKNSYIPKSLLASSYQNSDDFMLSDEMLTDQACYQDFDLPYKNLLQKCVKSDWQGRKHEYERLDYVSEFNEFSTTSKSLNIEVFNITDEGTYLATANQGRSRNMNSAIYKWNGNGFSFYQDIITSNAHDCEFFTINNESFLAFANYGTVKEKKVLSVVYRWVCDLRKFIPHQYISTLHARFIKSFKINKNTFIITSNNDPRENYKDTSCIYIWKTDERCFKRYQTLHTMQAYDAEHFIIDSNHFLAIANHFQGVSTRVHSVIYKWTKSGFEPNQYIETAGASDFEYFNISGKHFLSVANSYDKSEYSDTFSVDSQIYCYDDLLEMFVEFQKIPTYSAFDLEFFFLGRDSFIVAAGLSDKKKELENIIYRWQGVEGFVPVHWVKTPPSSDWEKFTVTDGKHFLVSASVSSSSKKSKIFRLITF